MKLIRFMVVCVVTVIIFALFSGMASTDTGKYITELNTAAEFYVATNGDDNNPGTIDEPFATIEAARDAIRAIRRSYGMPSGGVTVYIRGGIYYAYDTINISGQDSGSSKSPIIYSAYNGEEVIISGGRELDIRDFKKVSGEMKKRLRDKTAREKVMVLDLKAAGITDVGQIYSGNTSELFVNGERLTLARYPNDTYTCLLGKKDENGRWGALSGNAFGGATSYYSEKDAVLDEWTSYNGVYIIGYLGADWSDCKCEMLGLDKENKTFEIGPGSGYGYNCYRDFYFENVYDEIDMPGEYYIDRENMMLYLYPTKDIKTSRLTISQNSGSLLNVSANYVTIKDIRFEVSRRNGISASGNYITIDGNEVIGMHGGGISVNGKYNKVINNYVHDIGQTGISVSGGSSSSLEASKSVVDNNAIFNFGIIGKTYMPGISAHGNGIVVSHNEIAYAPHMAIGYSGQNIIFEYNRIHNVCQETGDSGAVYAGRRWDWDSCIFRYNFLYDIHDLLSINDEGEEQGHPNGIYWDDAISGQVAYGNIIYDVSGNGIYAGGGRNNVIYNNILVAVGYYDDADDTGKAFAIKYDTRASGTNWAWQIVPYSSGSMWGELMNFPYNSKIWKYKFPVLALLKETNYNDSTNPDVGGNNSYGVVRNNIVVEKRTTGLYEGRFTIHSTLRDNMLYRYREDVGFVDCDNLDFTLRKDSRALYDLPCFEIIDCNYIGLRK